MLSPKKILVVDDETPIREVIYNTLRLNGFDVAQAADAESALEQARANPPDLIISDVMMSGLSGYEMVSAVRSDPLLASTPVILMTGQADLPGLRRGMSLGADDYLAKPFTVQELLDAVNVRLSKSGQLKATAERHLSELRSHISSALPHELLTPLTGILSAADLLQAEAGELSRDEVAEYASMIKVSGERLHRLVQNFLTYTHIELLRANPDALATLSQQVSENAEDVITAKVRKLAAVARRADDLQLELQPAALPIAAHYLEKIVEELVGNALKFSSAGTPVTVRLLVTPAMAMLAVSDKGRGMASDQLARIGAYLQFDRKLQEQQGTGLGLIIARRLVELHHGQFAIESQPESGTTVTLTFAIKA